MKRRKLLLAIPLLLVAAGVFYLTQRTHHSGATRAPAPIVATGDPVRDGIRRAINWLEVQQEADGEFSAGMLDPKPAYTALVVDALARSPEDVRAQPWFQRAVQAIASHQQPDGGIYTPGLGLDGYCTAISLMALTHAGELPAVREKARAYVASCQVDGTGTPMDGGFGYSKGASSADLSNTAMALEALKEAGLSKDDPVCKNVQKFLDATHNDSESNKATWAANDGGFVYRPGESKAGSFVDDQGVTRFRSYGLMSYAGLLSFLTAYVDKNDPRVQSAWKWVESNWDLENNRGLEQKGLYYYYLTMAKALQAYDQRTVSAKDGPHDWPVELAQAILARQKPDGSWQNADRTWYENDPVLVTAYMVRALSICHGVAAVGSR